LDWLSRPPADIPRVFRGRPVALMGATPGLGSTGLAQAAWLPVLRTLGTLPYFETRLMVASAGKVFDAEGRVVDTGVQDRIKTFVEGFALFAQKHR
jgi:NAD(P)H-dependent FMN reductase